MNGPDFICFGMQKAGTRWLFDQMNARRDVWMPPIKELNYFVGGCLKDGNTRTISRGDGSLPESPLPGDKLRKERFLRQFSQFDARTSTVDWYRSLFSHKGSRRSGDVSPRYSILAPEKIATIATEFPATRFIMLVREPVDRLWSGLCMNVRKKRLSADEITHWTTLREVLTRDGVAAKSFPSRLWQDWAAQIPSERIRYWFFEDIIARPGEVVDEICAFIGIEPGPGFLPANYNRKANKTKIAMPMDIRERLIEYFADEHEACARMFGGHAVGWRDRYRAAGRSA